MKQNVHYRSALGPKIDAYISARRNQGCKFVTGAEVLHRLDSFAFDMDWKDDSLGKELVIAFVAPRPGEATRTRELRASTLRCFATWLVRCGEVAYILPRGAVPSSGRYCTAPRLLTEDDVKRLLNAADSMSISPISPLRHIVIPTMLRTIYCCGLRISEACNLAVGDVDLNKGILTIRQTKFNKDRYVPISPELLIVLSEYASAIRLSIRSTNSAFFPSPEGFYRRCTIGYAYRKLLLSAGIPHYDDGPTLHSLRHSFAVHRLAHWMEEGKDVVALLPYLSAYMGHEGLSGTERYLRLTAEMYPSLRLTCEEVCGSLIPEVICF